MSSKLFMGGLAFVAAAMLACAGEAPIVEVTGECAGMYQSDVCTWARMQGDSVMAAGAVIQLASIENAPDEVEMAWPPPMVAVLRLPEPAVEQAGLSEVTVYWEPHGHPPGPYLTPHFDFHFYTITRDERLAIDCNDLSKPATLPAGYSLPDVVLPPPLAAMAGADTLMGLCVEEMGMHSLLTTELESTEEFRGSIVVGYYQGNPIFVEPMVTRELLMEKRSFDLPIPSIPGMTGIYPRSFQGEYDAEEELYRFQFTDFRAGA